MLNIPKHRLLSRFVGLLSRAVLALLLASSGAVTAGTLHVKIDSSQFGAASGYLDMQLSASAGVPLATVVVSNMVGFDSGAYVDSWGVAPVPGGFMFRNDTANDLFHAVDFGGVLSFDLSFSGESDPLTTYVSRFVVSAFDDAYGSLGKHDPLTGALVDFSWTPGIDARTPGSIGILLSDAAVTVIPEPADWQLLGAGLLAIGLALRTRVGRRTRPRVQDLTSL